MTRAPAYGVRALTLAFAISATACGSGDGSNGGDFGRGGSGGKGTMNPNDTCALDITVEGDANLELDLDDELTCLTAYTTAPGAYVGFGPAPVDEVALVAMSFPELEPEETAASLELPVTIHHADRTQFSLMGCVVDVTENAFNETTEGGDVYWVVGNGSCSEPGTSGDRSVNVVGSFRFSARVRWQN